MENDSIYFERRADEERAAASKSLNSSAQRAHLDMAERYDGLVKARETRGATVVVPIRG